MHSPNAPQRAPALRTTLPWLAPCVALGGLSLAVLPSSHELGRGAAAGWFLLSAAGPTVLAFALRQASKLREGVRKFSVPALDIELPPMSLVASGVALLVVALSASDAVNALPFSGWARGAAVVIVSAFFVTYGAALYVYAKVAGLAVRLGRSPIRSETFAWPGTAVRTVHGVYVSLLVVGTVLYLLGVAVVWFSPGGKWLTMHATWMRLWVLPPGVAVLSFFATFSVSLHQVLVQCRERAEAEISEQLQELYASWKKDRSPTSEGSISALLSWREAVRREPLWPMDPKAAAATVLTILIPSIEAILELVRRPG